MQAETGNPYIDGSVPLPRGGAYSKCDVAGHYVFNSMAAIGDALLTKWECA